MHYALIAASSLLVVLLALGWAKEFRLRRALQNLLTRIFSPWVAVAVLCFTVSLRKEAEQ